MSSRKEEKERLRAQRLASEAQGASSQRRRLILGYVLAGALTVAVVVGLVAVIASGGDNGGGGGGGTAELCDNASVATDFGSFDGLEPDCREGTPPPELEQGDLAIAARQAGCTLREDLADEGNEHVPNSREVVYGTNPPTSGNHNPEPAADGAYLTPLNADPSKGGNDMNVRNFVHSLEHGRIEIHYAPNLPEAQQLELKGVFDADPGGMLLFPNPEMPFEVAVTAWRAMMTCDSYDPKVRDAIIDFRDAYRGQGPENIQILHS